MENSGDYGWALSNFNPLLIGEAALPFELAPVGKGAYRCFNPLLIGAAALP